MLIRFLIKEKFLYFSAIFLTFVVLALIFYSPNFEYSVPLVYRGDALVTDAMIKSIFDTNQYTIMPFLAAPGILDLSAFPIFNPFLYLVVETLKIFFNEFGSIVNTLYFLTYFLTTLVSVPVFRSIGLNKFFSLISGLLFSFLPYHLLRGEGHLILANLFVIPIFIFLALRCYKAEKFFAITKPINTKALSKSSFLVLLCIIATCCSGLGYYAYFGCFLLLIAGVVGSVDKKKWAPCLTCICLVTISCLTFLATISPKIWTDIKYGNTLGAFARAPEESEIFSLKMTQLLFPVINHRVNNLAEFNSKYLIASPLNNENYFSALGAIGGIGFLILLSLLFVKKWQEHEILFFLGILNFSCLLLSITGGFGAIIAYTLFTVIRCYNRISVYISFLSLAAFFLVIQFALEKLSLDKNRLTISFLSGLILVIGLLDEIPRVDKNYPKTVHNQFSDDKQFIKTIEISLPKNSFIFQLPYVVFPESPDIYNLKDYEHLKPYLHSNGLHWSYGVTRGSASDEWQKSLNSVSTQEIVDQVSILGFRGIYINKKGYPENGKKIEHEMNEILNSRPVTNKDGTILFYNLQPYIYKKQLENSAEWRTKIKKVREAFMLECSWCKGFYSLEKRNSSTWRWSNKKGNLRIVNSLKYDLPVAINFTIQGSDSEGDIYLEGDLINEHFKLDKEIKIAKNFILTPGVHIIKFKTNAKKTFAPSDPRSMYFRVNDFALKILD